MLRVVLGFVVGVVVSTTRAGEPPPMPPAERSAMLADFNQQVIALGTALAKSPGDVSLYSRRGDLYLFLGQFANAVADFEKMIALDASLDAPHWRLGIAYHFTGDFEKSSRQFEKYHGYDGVDRENGIWKFLADVKVSGLEPARRAMLAYSRFDREPFPTLYEVFAGAKTTADLFARIRERRLGEYPKVMFFANYYGGLNEEVLGRHKEALTLLRAAVASPWGRTAEGGPAYMWQAARLHYELLSAPRKPTTDR